MLAFDWASPSGDQSAMFGTESYGTGFNFMKYSNPAYDEANTAASATLDPQERFDLLVQASNIVNDDAPLIITWFRSERTGYNKRMVNFTPRVWKPAVVAAVRGDFRVNSRKRRGESFLPALLFCAMLCSISPLAHQNPAGSSRLRSCSGTSSGDCCR